MEYDTSLMIWGKKTIDGISTSLLSNDDLEKLQRCTPAIQHSFSSVQMYRTRTEMEVSVLSDIKFPTADSKYWQSIREMNVFVENLVMLSFTYREKTLDLRQLDDEHSKDTPKTSAECLAYERRNIAIERTKFEIQCIQRDAHHRIREIDEWRDIQDKLLPDIVAGTMDVNNHQLISYAIRFLQEYKIFSEHHATKSMDEARNLKGLLMTTLRVVSDKGLTEVLLKSLDPELGRFAKGLK